MDNGLSCSKLDGNDTTILSHHPYILIVPFFHFRGKWKGWRRPGDKPRTALAWASSALPLRQYLTEHWRRLKPEVFWVRLPATAGLFIFLYFRLIACKFLYFQCEARCSEHIEWEKHSAWVLSWWRKFSGRPLTKFWQHILSGCQVCDWGIQYHLSSTYRGLWGLVVVQLSWLSGRALAAKARGIYPGFDSWQLPASIFKKDFSPHNI